MATNPLYNLGQVSFLDDPYQVKVMRKQLMQAGLWDPAWDAWANFQQAIGDVDALQEPLMPDLSSLDGYSTGYGDYGGGSRRADLLDASGGVLVDNPYFYDEPALFQGQDLMKAAALVGGGALGMNALFGGLGAAGGIPLSAAEMGVGGFPAGMEGYGFMPASGAAEGAPLGTAAGGYGGLTGGGLLTGNAGATLGAEGLGSLGLSAGGYGGLGEAGGVMAGLSGAGGGGGGLLSTLGRANSLANLASAGIGLYGQNKAIGAMQDATNQAHDFNRYAFDTIRADNKPLVDMRNSVLPQIQGLLSNPSSIQQDPGYAFQFAEGQKALNNGAAGRGMTYSGAQGKALQRYGQDYAGTKLDQSLNRLTTVAGLGQVGSNSNNAATQNYANNQSGNALQMGNARGSAYGGMAQGVNNALLNIFDPWQYGRVNWGT